MHAHPFSLFYRCAILLGLNLGIFRMNTLSRKKKLTNRRKT